MKDFKKEIAIIVVIIGIVIVALSSNNETTLEKNMFTDKTYEVSERDSQREAYNEGCIDEGGNTKYCNCTYDYFMDEMGEDEFELYSIDFLNEDLTDKQVDLFWDSVTDCLQFLN